MIRVDQAETDKIVEEYAKGRELRNKIVVELDDVNNVDTLILLRVMTGTPDINALAPLVETFLDGHKITFKIGEEVLKTVNYNKGSGNALHLMFRDEPYLYDLLQQTVYTLLLKKLTPRSEGSNS